MKEILLNITRRLSNLLKEQNALVILWLMFNTFLIIAWPLYLYMELNYSIYHFYMNTKTSLENIHDVELDSYDGTIAHKLTTEEKLIRRNSQKCHVRYLFK